MLEHIPELMESGIDSFKIEGRMKSAYYTAVTANAYRIAMDLYRADSSAYTLPPELLRELDSVSHREYGTGFYFDAPAEEANLCTQPGYLREKAFLAVASDNQPADGTPLFLQRNKFSVGDTVELLQPGKTGIAFTVSALRAPDGTPLASVPHPGMPFSLDTPVPITAGDILRGT